MVKWSTPGKGIALFLTSRCSSYCKGSLLVTPDYGRQLTYTLSNDITPKMNAIARLQCELTTMSQSHVVATTPGKLLFDSIGDG